MTLDYFESMKLAWEYALGDSPATVWRLRVCREGVKSRSLVVAEWLACEDSLKDRIDILEAKGGKVVSIHKYILEPTQ